MVDQIIQQWTPETENSKTDDREQQQLIRIQMDFLFGLKRLRAEISQENYADAVQQLSRMRPQTADMEVLVGWEEQKIKLAEYLGQLDQTAQLEWANEVNDFIDDVHKVCKNAQSAGDLDAELIRGTSLQAGQHTRGNAWGERSMKKLDGALFTLTQLATYFDFKNAGKLDAANQAIKQLLTDQSRFPVLDIETTQAFLLDSPADWKEEKLYGIVFRDYHSLDDIDLTLAHLAETSPEVNRQHRESLETLLHQFQSSRILIKANQYTEALQSVTSRYPSTSSGAFIYYQIMLDSVIGAIVTNMAERWEVTEVISGKESTEERVQALAEALIAEAKLTELLELSRLLESNRKTKELYPKWAESVPTVTLYNEAYAADQAEQYLIAYQKYREVISTGKYPSDLMLNQVTKRMQTIREEHPEVESEANNQLEQKLQELRRENQSLNRRLEMYMRRGETNRP